MFHRVCCIYALNRRRTAALVVQVILCAELGAGCRAFGPGDIPEGVYIDTLWYDEGSLGCGELPRESGDTGRMVLFWADGRLLTYEIDSLYPMVPWRNIPNADFSRDWGYSYAELGCRGATVERSYHRHLPGPGHMYVTTTIRMRGFASGSDPREDCDSVYTNDYVLEAECRWTCVDEFGSCGC